MCTRRCVNWGFHFSGAVNSWARVHPVQRARSWRYVFFVRFPQSSRRLRRQRCLALMSWPFESEFLCRSDLRQNAVTGLRQENFMREMPQERHEGAVGGRATGSRGASHPAWFILGLEVSWVQQPLALTHPQDRGKGLAGCAWHFVPFS